MPPFLSDEVVAARAERGTATLARGWLDAMNSRDAPRLRAMLSDDFAWDAGTAPARGPDEAVRLWRAWFDRLPDFVLEPLHELEHDEWSIQLLRLRGTQHRAAPAGFACRPAPPVTVASCIDLPGCAVHVTRDRCIARLWTYWDESALTRATSSARPPADF